MRREGATLTVHETHQTVEQSEKREKWQFAIPGAKITDAGYETIPWQLDHQRPAENSPKSDQAANQLAYNIFLKIPAIYA